jgi:glycosyltransferase involved in cell wall biosynthesis
MTVPYEVFMANPKAFGGTEYMVKNFKEKILPYAPQLKNYLCLVLPGINPDIKIETLKNVKVIIWLHNTFSQFGKQTLKEFKEEKIKNNIAYIVVVSEYQKYVIAKEIDFDLDKIVVIPNAIDPVVPKPHKFESVNKPKLIHASSADRGMEVLLKSLKHIDVDFELNIFNDFNPDLLNVNPRLISDKRINFYGKTPKKTVMKYFANSHLHAYPSIFPETSCLTQMEALSAGCFSVYTDLGALPETSLGYGTMIPYNELTPERYAQEITKAINEIKTNGFDYNKQSKEISERYSWDVAKQNWINFAERLP